jgi:serpin B
MTTPTLRPFLLATLVTASATAQPPTDAQRLAASCNRFAADLHGRLGAADTPTCSPASIAIALLMLLPGAQGDTARELAAVLHLPEDLRGDRLHAAARGLLRSVGARPPDAPAAQRPPLFVVANDLWVQQGFALAPGYAPLLHEYFAAALRQTDFAGDPDAARRTINAQVARVTNDRIRELLQPGMVQPATRVVLTNAIWFKAGWEHEFWDRNTTDAPFTLADGSSVPVPTMDRVEHFLYTETDAWQWVALPFAGCAVQCEIVLPRPAATLAAAEQALLAGDHLTELRSHRVRVKLPRFRVAAAHRLADALRALGLRTAFDAARADFRGIATQEPLVIDEVVHRTWIQVDEKGAEAAAATATVLKAGAAATPAEPKLFQADRPFAFVLRDRSTGLILFVGRVTDPRQRDS